MLCAEDGSEETSDVDDSQSESTADKESRPDAAASLSRPSPSIVYLNDLFGGSRSLISDMSEDRCGMAPRSEAGRKLLRKRQKREQRRAKVTFAVFKKKNYLLDNLVTRFQLFWKLGNVREFG